MEIERIIFPSHIKSDINSYNFLFDIIQKTKELSFKDIVFDFKNVEWFEANLCGILGLIIDKIKENLNNVTIKNVNNRVEDVLNRNHFLHYVNSSKIENDYNNTTIKFKKSTVQDEKLIRENILNNELISKDGFPNMSKQAKKKMEDCIYEIFSNCFIHGETEAFSCGQYYPSSQKHRLSLTISNKGETIKEKLYNIFKKDISEVESIKWAIKKGNSTKE